MLGVGPVWKCTRAVRLMGGRFKRIHRAEISTVSKGFQLRNATRGG